MIKKEAEIFVRVDQSLLDALKSEAEKCGTTVSSIVRMILLGQREPVGVSLDGAKAVIARRVARRAADKSRAG